MRFISSILDGVYQCTSKPRRALAVVLMCCLGLVFAALLFRNPFSDRTLIPNFEPFPDGFHYVTPIRCFLAGEGWRLCREGRYIAPSVPPVYSLTLLPFIAIFKDPRSFYFANVGFAITSFLLLIVIGRQLAMHRYAIVMMLGVFVLNTYVTWVPTLAMAENLLIPLFLTAVVLFLLPVRRATAIAMGVIVTSFYATKYAALPQSLVFGIGYFLKICWHIRSGRVDAKTARHLVSLLIMSAVMAALVLIPAQTEQIIRTLVQVGKSLLPVKATVIENSVSGSTLSGVSTFFSLTYFQRHAVEYLGLFWGKPLRFLWEASPLLAPLWAVLGCLGLGLLLVRPSRRVVSILLCCAIGAQIAFMSLFYTADARYVYTLLPTLLIGVMVCGDVILNRVEKLQKIPYGSSVLCVFFLVILLFSQRVYLKKQIGLNLKYAETPWWYLAIEHLNTTVMPSSSSDERRPVVITAMPPYLVDFYSTGAYQLLPLSHDHDFRGERVALWGEYQYDDLLELYTSFLKDGRSVYVTNYGIGNEKPRQADFAAIQSAFHLELVDEGCLGACNVWKVGERRN